MREKFVQSMAKQVEAQLHEESKLWSFIALFQANQVCKEENQRRNIATINFAWLCEIFTQHAKSRGASIATGQRAGMSERNFAHHEKPFETAKNFAHHSKFRMVCEIFLCTDSVRFLSSDILCNFLVSPCNQFRYFLLYLLGSRYIRRDMCDIEMDVFY